MRTAVVVVLAALAGCAGTSSVSRGALSDVREVRVEPFESRDASVSAYVADKLAERLADVAGMRVVVAREGDARAVVTGSVDASEYEVGTRMDGSPIIEYSITLRSEVRRAGASETAWKGTSNGRDRDMFRAIEMAAVSLGETLKTLFVAP